MAYVGDLFTCVDFIVREGSEDEFLSLWHRASEWAFVNDHSPRSWYLVRDPDNPQLFRSLTLWPTGTTEEDIASDPTAEEFMARCAPICTSVEGKALYLADALGGLTSRLGPQPRSYAVVLG